MIIIKNEENKEIFDRLEDLNKGIEILIKKRAEYMDSVMKEISPYKIGDEYTNIKTGEKTRVEKIYRRGQVGDRNIFEDNSISEIFAAFENGDNTSRYGYEWKCPYIKSEDYENKTQKYYELLEQIVKYQDS